MHSFGLYTRDGPILLVSVSLLISAVSSFFRISVLVSVSIENWVPALLSAKNICYLPIILVVYASVSAVSVILRVSVLVSVTVSAEILVSVHPFLITS